MRLRLRLRHAPGLVLGFLFVLALRITWVSRDAHASPLHLAREHPNVEMDQPSVMMPDAPTGRFFHVPTLS